MKIFNFYKLYEFKSTSSDPPLFSDLGTPLSVIPLHVLNNAYHVSIVFLIKTMMRNAASTM